jgi:hypothetical protein
MLGQIDTIYLLHLQLLCDGVVVHPPDVVVADHVLAFDLAFVIEISKLRRRHFLARQLSRSAGIFMSGER